MADFYTRMASTADRLLGSKGRAFEVRRTEMIFDPLTSTSVEGEVTTQTLNAVRLSAKTASYDVTLTEKEIVGEMASMILSTVGASFVPEPLDQIIEDGSLWTIYGVSNISPAGQDVIYKIGIMFAGVENKGFPFTFPLTLT
jgi:hypothetical protein